MKYINNYEDYLREYKQFINHENSENMNEGVKHWLATFLMLVNLGIVPPAIMAANNDEVKKEFVQDKETLDMVASKFKTYYNQNNFYNTPEYAWEDFQKVYGTSTYDINDIVKSASISTELNEKIPTPTNYVNDYAEIFVSENVEDELNKLLSEYEKTSGMEIAIVTVNTFQNMTYMSTFSQDVFETWGVGKVGSDNGILIAINEKDRDWRIQTGYGAEIVLTDATCSRLAHELMLPDLANDNFEEGITKVVHGIMEHIGDNSEDIEQFKEDYKKAKAEKLEKIKDGFISAISIIAILGLLGWLLAVIIKKSKEKSKIKERSISLLADINILIGTLEKELVKSNELDYLKQIRDDFDQYIKYNDVPNDPTSNQELVDKLFKYTKDLGGMISKAKQFNSYYKEALGVDSMVKLSKNYLQMIDEINNKLSLYGKKSSNTITADELDKVAVEVKKNMDSQLLFNSVEKLKRLYTSTRSSMNSILSVQEDIPVMKEKLSKYKEQVQKWADSLKHYNISEHTTGMMDLVKKFEKTLSLPDKDLFKKYAMYLAIMHFVDGVINDEKTRLRRIKEEKERKERRKRDEEAAARRRRNSYSSSSSSYGGGGGSSFGGFGGGSSGGGGAGGRF